jgi:hypothetical protein
MFAQKGGFYANVTIRALMAHKMACILDSLLYRRLIWSRLIGQKHIQILQSVAGLDQDIPEGIF